MSSKNLSQQRVNLQNAQINRHDNTADISLLVSISTSNFIAKKKRERVEHAANLVGDPYDIPRCYSSSNKHPHLDFLTD
jgi:hypothetical protein